MRDRTISTVVTVIAPPIRVAICANGIRVMRLAAVRMATSPVPPWPLWQAFTMAASMGYIFIQYPTKAPIAISVATVETMVITVGRLKAAINLSHGVSDTPIANNNGYV